MPPPKELCVRCTNGHNGQRAGKVIILSLLLSTTNAMMHKTRCLPPSNCAPDSMLGRMENDRAQEIHAQGDERRLSAEHRDLGSAWSEVPGHKELCTRLGARHKKCTSAQSEVPTYTRCTPGSIRAKWAWWLTVQYACPQRTAFLESASLVIASAHFYLRPDKHHFWVKHF